MIMKRLILTLVALFAVNGQTALAECKGSSVPGRLGCEATDLFNGASKKADDINAGIAAQQAADALAQERSREAGRILEQSIIRRNDEMAHAAQEAAERSARQNLLRNQAQHAWKPSSDPTRDQQWIRRGINNPEELEVHISNIRKNPDLSRELEGGRSAFGKFDVKGRKSGTIVIDNPADKINGGTAFPNDDIVKRMGRL